jgi:hypothetical protein
MVQLAAAAGFSLRLPANSRQRAIGTAAHRERLAGADNVEAIKSLVAVGLGASIVPSLSKKLH